MNSQTWIKGALARTADGVECSPRDSRATQFCLYGWLQHKYDGDELAERIAAVRRKLVSRGLDGSLVFYNDVVAKSVDDIVELLTS